jgi:hypothetical protein
MKKNRQHISTSPTMTGAVLHRTAEFSRLRWLPFLDLDGMPSTRFRRAHSQLLARSRLCKCWRTKQFSRVLEFVEFVTSLHQSEMPVLGFWQPSHSILGRSALSTWNPLYHAGMPLERWWAGTVGDRWAAVSDNRLVTQTMSQQPFLTGMQRVKNTFVTLRL